MADIMQYDPLARDPLENMFRRMLRPLAWDAEVSSLNLPKKASSAARKLAIH